MMSHLDIFILLVTPFWMSSSETSRSCSTAGSCSFSFAAAPLLLPRPPPPAEWEPTLKDWERKGVREPKVEPRPPPKLNTEAEGETVLTFGNKIISACFICKHITAALFTDCFSPLRALLLLHYYLGYEYLWLQLAWLISGQALITVPGGKQIKFGFTDAS